MPDDSRDTPVTEERQRAPRQSVMCRAVLTVGEIRQECDILDLSVSGAKIRGQKPIQAKQLITLEVRDHGALKGRVIWAKDGLAGITLHENPDEIEEVMLDLTDPGSNPKERRGYPRTSVLLMGKIRSGIELTDCRILNLSASGAKIKTARPIRDGIEIALIIERVGELACEAVWRDSELLGIRFDEDPEVVAQRLERFLARKPSILKRPADQPTPAEAVTAG